MTSPTDWTTSGTEQVADQVFRIPLPLPTDALKAVNVYLIEGRAGPTLIDGGWHVRAAETELKQSLGDLGLDAAAITRCLVTHHHRDHYSMAVHLRRETGLPVGLGDGERENLKGCRDPEAALALHLAKLRRCGATPIIDTADRGIAEDVDIADYADPDFWVQDGHRFPAHEENHLRARATPGHTAGHVVYIDDGGGLMYSGDHLLPHITPSIGLQPSKVEMPLRSYLDSLKAVLDEEDMTMLPAHGPAGGSTHRRANELLVHHEVRLGHTESAVHDGAATAYEAAERLLWTRRERTFAELDLYNQTLAVIETLAHLDVLEAQGRLSVREIDGLAEYSR